MEQREHNGNHNKMLYPIFYYYSMTHETTHGVQVLKKKSELFCSTRLGDNLSSAKAKVKGQKKRKNYK